MNRSHTCSRNEAASWKERWRNSRDKIAATCGTRILSSPMLRTGLYVLRPVNLNISWCFPTMISTILSGPAQLAAWPDSREILYTKYGPVLQEYRSTSRFPIASNSLERKVAQITQWKVGRLPLHFWTMDSTANKKPNSLTSKFLDALGWQGSPKAGGTWSTGPDSEYRRQSGADTHRRVPQCPWCSN